MEILMINVFQRYDDNTDRLSIECRDYFIITDLYT